MRRGWGAGVITMGGLRNLSHHLTHLQTGAHLASMMGRSLRYNSQTFLKTDFLTTTLQVNWMAVPEGEEGGQVMFEWEEQDRFSFEDSDRFEEVALTSSFIILDATPSQFVIQKLLVVNDID